METAAVEQWLDDYGFECRTYHAIISRDACRTQQARARHVVGSACWSCPESDLEYDDRPRIVVHGSVYDSKRGRCSHCGAEIGPDEKRCAKHAVKWNREDH